MAALLASYLAVNGLLFLVDHGIPIRRGIASAGGFFHAFMLHCLLDNVRKSGLTIRLGLHRVGWTHLIFGALILALS